MVLAVNMPAQLPIGGAGAALDQRQLLVGQRAGGAGPDGLEHAHDVERLARRGPGPGRMLPP